MNTKYFYTSQGVRTQGSIVTRSASSQTIQGNKTYSSGYYPSSWTVTGLDTSDATAAASMILEGYTAYARGQKITGTKPAVVSKYTGTVSNLSTASIRLSHDSAHIGDYLLLPMSPNSLSSLVETYSSSLVKGTINLLNNNKGGAAYNSKYALIGGTVSSQSASDQLTTYDSSLTRGTASLSIGRNQIGTSTIGQYALFASGQSTNTDVVDAFNESLVRSNPSVTSYNGPTCGSRNANYALFLQTTDGYLSCYNSSLSKTTASPLSVARNDRLGIAYLNNYAIFAGGCIMNYSDASNRVDFYNNNLTRSTSTLSNTALGQMGTYLCDNAIIAGGVGLVSGNVQYFGTVDLFNNLLVRSNPTGLNQGRQQGLTGYIGMYAIIAGGWRTGGNLSNIVDVYMAG